jgi:hypothetical protein
MRDDLYGIAQDKDQNTTGAMAETFDGGVTWTNITISGQVGTTDYCYVPGTDNTWVSTETDYNLPVFGSFYSFDGGHSWASFQGTETTQYIAIDFVNNHCGWAGGFNVSATEGGVFKYVGMLDPGQSLNTVTGLTAQVTESTVHLNWNAPSGGTTVLGYNIYRNDTLLNSSPVTVLNYNDLSVANGKQTYCVTAVYSGGESQEVCVDAWVTVGIPNTDPAAYRVYPNPATEVINISTPVPFSQVRLFSLMGQEVYTYNTPGNNLRILTEGFVKGMYILKINADNRIITKQVSIQ